MGHIENIEKMVECLVDKAKATLDGNIETVDTHEMGEVIDMIKDLSEAKYKCLIAKAMKDADEEEEMRAKLGLSEDDSRRGYSASRRREYPTYQPMYYGNSRMYDDGMMRDMDRDQGRMYYNGSSSSSSGSNYSGNSINGSNSGSMSNMGNSSRNYTESRYDRNKRGYEDTRRMYSDDSTESKKQKMNGLEKFLKVIDSDVMEFAPDMTQEEKTLAKQKLTATLSKL